MLFLAKEEAVSRRNAPMLLSVPTLKNSLLPEADAAHHRTQDTGDIAVEKHRLEGMKRHCQALQ